MAKLTKIQIFGGPESSRSGVVLATRELFLSTDEGCLFFGDGTIGPGRLIGPHYTMSPGQPSGSYVGNATHVGRTANGSLLVGLISYAPINLSNDVSGELYLFDELGVVVQVAGSAGDTTRMALYTNKDGQPGTLVVETAELPNDTTGLLAGVFTAPIALKPGWYWGGIQNSATKPSYLVQRDTSTLTIIPAVIGAGGATVSWIETFTYGPFPTTPGTLVANTSDVPIMGVARA